MVAPSGSITSPAGGRATEAAWPRAVNARRAPLGLRPWGCAEDWVTALFLAESHRVTSPRISSDAHGDTNTNNDTTIRCCRISGPALHPLHLLQAPPLTREPLATAHPTLQRRKLRLTRCSELPKVPRPTTGRARLDPRDLAQARGPPQCPPSCSSSSDPPVRSPPPPSTCPVLILIQSVPLN